MILIEISQRTAVLCSDWSLQMALMGPKMTFGTFYNQLYLKVYREHHEMSGQ